MSSAPTPSRLAVLVASAGLLASCAREEPPGASKLPGEAEARASSSTPIASVALVASASASAAASAVPPEDSLPIGPEYVVEDGAGVSIAALANPTYVYDLPDFSKRKLGYARPGAILHRAEKPVTTTKKCKDGWYRVAPRGFVCQNAELTTDLSHPLVQALAKKPRRGSPLPYIYGRSRAHPPHYYVRVPTRSQQRQAEGGVELAEHLDQASRSNAIAVTGQPDPLPPGLVPGQALPRPVNLWYKARSGATRGVANPRSSFAFFSVHDVEGRLFGLSTDFDMIAIDRVRLVTETRIHGGPVADLPAGIARNGTPRYRRDEGGKVTLDGAYEPFTAIALTGKTEGDLVETSEGTWVSPRALLPFTKRTSFPGWVTGSEKWVDVSIRDQTLVAYEGKRAVYVTQVSTGAGGDGDPETTSATIQGYFRIQAKHVTATMTGNRADVTEYELSDVPYVQYFHGGYALHAAFWHEKFGHPHSHGCVNLTPRDAAWLFEWTEPQVPEEWHGIEANGQGTLVYVH